MSKGIRRNRKHGCVVFKSIPPCRAADDALCPYVVVLTAVRGERLWTTENRRNSKFLNWEIAISSIDCWSVVRLCRMEIFSWFIYCNELNSHNAQTRKNRMLRISRWSHHSSFSCTFFIFKSNIVSSWCYHWSHWNTQTCTYIKYCTCFDLSISLEMLSSGCFSGTGLVPKFWQILKSINSKLMVE